eukprot:Gb_27012 [translate_table: standard]
MIKVESRVRQALSRDMSDNCRSIHLGLNLVQCSKIVLSFKITSCRSSISLECLLRFISRFLCIEEATSCDQVREQLQTLGIRPTKQRTKSHLTTKRPTRTAKKKLESPQEENPREEGSGSREWGASGGNEKLMGQEREWGVGQSRCPPPTRPWEESWGSGKRGEREARGTRTGAGSNDAWSMRPTTYNRWHCAIGSMSPQRPKSQLHSATCCKSLAT